MEIPYDSGLLKQGNMVSRNDATKRLYEQFGFVEIDRDEDEIIMELAL